MKTNVIVCGMHRSGTSAVTAAVREMGLYVGDDTELLRPQADNRCGFWERRDCVSVNDDLLSAAGGSWLNPVSFQTTDVPVEQRRKLESRARHIISILSAAPGSWVLKDPRFCVTAELWRPCAGAIVYVPVIRDPLSIANSLRIRDDLPVEFALALWEVYTRAMLRLLHRPYIPVIHSRLEQYPEQTVSTLHGDLRDRGVVMEPLDLTRVRSQWHPDHVHHHATRRELEAALSVTQLELYDYVSQLTNDAAIRSDMLEDSGVSRGVLERYGDAFSKLYADRRALANLRPLEVELKRTRATYEELHASHVQLSKAHSVEVEHRRSLEQAIDEQTGRLKSLQTELSESHAKSEFLFKRLTSVYQRLGEVDTSVAGRLRRSCISLLRLRFPRSRGSTGIGDLKREAERGLAEFGVRRREETHPTSRWSTVLLLLDFVRKNPRTLWRGVNRHRLRKLRAIVIDGNTSAAGSWLRERLSARGTGWAVPVLLPAGDTTEHLEFPVSLEPTVSIVVPVRNEYETTLSCLKSILAHSEGAYEVIVADDGSDDDTATITQRVSGIEHVKTPRNLGFLENCNYASTRARGDYLVFLNNDTNVQPGWLEALLRVFEAHPDVGVVGPKLLFEDGSLQEAGGIVWKDGSAWNYGRGQDPASPEYNYVREVDYVSGACLATRGTLWREIGGFDSTFSPAYYEDADYCFSVRQAGYRVLYQPHAAVVHKEGVSHGINLEQGVKAHQSSNQEVFRDKWAATLDTFHFENGQHLFYARDRSRDETTVLVIDHYVPFYDQDAGSRSMYQYLQYMVHRGLNVKFVGANFFPHQPYTATLQNLGVEVLVGSEFAASWPDWLHTYARHLDVVCVHRPHIAEEFLADIKHSAPQAKLVYFGVDLHYLRVSREAVLKGSNELAREADDWKRREFDIFRQVDTICFPSQVEIDEIRKEMPDSNLRVAPLYILDDPKPASEYRHAERKDLLFVGGFSHPPNEDAVLWFCSEVLPKLRTEIPDLRLHVVGSHTPPRVQSLRSTSVLVHGHLTDADLAALYRRVRIIVAPVRFGAGVKGKVLDALNHAVPIVTTPVGAEGLPQAASVMCIVETADEFVTAVRELYHDHKKARHYLDQYDSYIDRWLSERAISDFIDHDVLAHATSEAQGSVSVEQLIP